MPVYNGEKYLSSAIDSILAQSFSNFELIIVNDGSIDNSSEIIASYVLRDKRILAISTENRGASSARNTGLKMAKAKYISVIDADDLWVPEKIYDQLSEIQKDDSRIIIGGVRRFNVLEKDDFIWGKESMLPPKKLNKEEYIKFLLSLSLTQMCIFHTLCARKDFLISEGGWDEDLTSAEDWDFWIRLSLKHKFHHIEKISLLYRKHTESQTQVTGYKTPLNSQMKIIMKVFREGVISKSELKKFAGYRYLEIIESQMYAGRKFQALKLGLDAIGKTNLYLEINYYKLLGRLILDQIKSIFQDKVI
jgi:glycosyltransferase involved in cell wall biosynthesis